MQLCRPAQPAMNSRRLISDPTEICPPPFCAPQSPAPSFFKSSPFSVFCKIPLFDGADQFRGTSGPQRDGIRCRTR
jgi:hypothetical protein